jgi:ABC-type Fe3+-hydroxamate transport system substrate-binding protein
LTERLPEFALCLILCLAPAAAGCRPSPVLVQTVYRPETDAADKDNETKLVDNRPEYPEQSDELFPMDMNPSSPDQRDRVRQNPLEGEGESEEEAPRISYDPAAGLDFRAQNRPESPSSSPGPAPDDAARTAPEPSEVYEPRDMSDSESSANDAAQALDGGAGTGGTGVRGHDFAPDTASEGRQIVDAYGASVVLPEKAERLAAAGEAAVMIQMLGGGGRLAAADRDFLSGTLTQAVFADEGISQTVSLWSDDGSTPMTDASFQSLLALRPQVCLEISGRRSFSDDQIAQMRRMEIAYVVLPPLNTSANLKLAVSVTGEILGDMSGAGGTDAPSLAQDYIAYYDSAVREIGAKVRRFTHNLIDFDNDKKVSGVRYLQDTSLTSVQGFYSLFITDCPTSPKRSASPEVTPKNPEIRLRQWVPFI